MPTPLDKKFLNKLATTVHKSWIQDIFNLKLARVIRKGPKSRGSDPWWTRYTTNGRFQLWYMKYIMYLPTIRQQKAKSYRINLFNNLKRTNIAGGKLPREVCRKPQMISGQPSIWVHSKSNLMTMSLSIICHVSCWMSHSRAYQLQSRLHIRYTISNTLNRPISDSTHCMF